MAKTTKSAPGQQVPEPQGTAEPNEQKMPVEQEGRLSRKEEASGPAPA